MLNIGSSSNVEMFMIYNIYDMYIYNINVFNSVKHKYI